jgi:hypothetical protein
MSVSLYGLLPCFVSFRFVPLFFFPLYFRYFSWFPRHSIIFLLFLFLFLFQYHYQITCPHLSFPLLFLHSTHTPSMITVVFTHYDSYILLVLSFLHLLRYPQFVSTFSLHDDNPQFSFHYFPPSLPLSFFFFFFSICYVRFVVFHCLLFSLLLLLLLQI